jgi:glyoxylase-like metal-dependent hydrolase (beta-lactamase superfamily II)
MKVYILETGKFKLDGGAMFGVVPKRMWNTLNPSDDNNLCTWEMRCLLVIDGARKILIDTGIGTKQDEKFRSHFLPFNQQSFDVLLSNIGLSCEDITDVLLTHLHFDHVGGALYKDDRGLSHTTFPNATYWTNEVHYKWAYDPNPREFASFLRENFVPLKDMGVLRMIDIEPGIKFTENITIDFVYGHTEAMMIPTIHLPNGKQIIYCADLCPSHAHVPLPYVMAYDMQPLKSMTEKQWLHDRALDVGTFLCFEHDKDISFGTITKNEKGKVVFEKPVNLLDIHN